jgi:hypothetical protein
LRLHPIASAPTAGPHRFRAGDSRRSRAGDSRLRKGACVGGRVPALPAFPHLDAARGSRSTRMNGDSVESTDGPPRLVVTYPALRRGASWCRPATGQPINLCPPRFSKHGQPGELYSLGQPSPVTAPRTRSGRRASRASMLSVAGRHVTVSAPSKALHNRRPRATGRHDAKSVLSTAPEPLGFRRLMDTRRAAAALVERQRRSGSRLRER